MISVPWNKMGTKMASGQDLLFTDRQTYFRMLGLKKQILHLLQLIKHKIKPLMGMLIFSLFAEPYTSSNKLA